MAIKTDIIKGLSITGSVFGRKKDTQMFPEQRTPTSTRFRGVLALTKFESGVERCIACRLCEVNCPACAITIEVEPSPDANKRTTKRFDIDMFKCINCGFCAEACPVDSIVVVPEIDVHIEKRGDNILTKDKLLAIGDLYREEIRQTLEVAEREASDDELI